KLAIERPIPDWDSARDWLANESGEFATSADGRRLVVAGCSWGLLPFVVMGLGDPKSAVRAEPPHRIDALAISPDGRLVAAAGVGPGDQDDPPTLLTLWEAGTGRKRAGVQLPAANACALGFSPDGKLLAVVGY